MSMFHTDLRQAVEILPYVMTLLFYTVNIMGADVLVMQGARASATMIFTMLNQIIGSPYIKD